jgi:hypothetical protein
MVSFRNNQPTIQASAHSTPTMAAPILRPLASLITAATEPLSVYYPYALANTLHAARIHMAYRGRTEAMGFKGKKSRLVDWAGFLIMVRRFFLVGFRRDGALMGPVRVVLVLRSNRC